MSNNLIFHAFCPTGSTLPHISLLVAVFKCTVLDWKLICSSVQELFATAIQCEPSVLYLGVTRCCNEAMQPYTHY